MSDVKREILRELHNLLSFNVLGSKQYINRFNGFTAELDFQFWYKEAKKSGDGGGLIEGGMFLPTKEGGKHCEQAVYFTSSEQSPDSIYFKDVYTRAAKLASEGLFFIQYDLSVPFESWEKIQLFSEKIKGQMAKPQHFPCPPFKVFEFLTDPQTFSPSTIDKLISKFHCVSQSLERKQIPNEVSEPFLEKFSSFDTELLMKLYLERLFFDGFLNIGYLRGMPLDIDSFAFKNEAKLPYIIEIKEKDISKNFPKGFGMDLDRIKSLDLLCDGFGYKALYVVRQVNNQTERKFVDWRKIDFEDFKQHIKYSPERTGGSGLRSPTVKTLTKVCLAEHFQVMDRISKFA